jgi:GNAT superfamily N-acetyltransferase
MNRTFNVYCDESRHLERAEMCFVRPIDYGNDMPDLSALLAEKDVSRLRLCRAAVDDGDAYILVAERNRRVIGVAIVHVAARDDMGWNPDEETPSFLAGTNAYLERMRRKGIGTMLLREVESEAQRRGKESLWLHTDETNAGAHRFYERNGWTHHNTVNPAWKEGRATRIYVKELYE